MANPQRLAAVLIVTLAIPISAQGKTASGTTGGQADKLAAHGTCALGQPADRADRLGAVSVFVPDPAGKAPGSGFRYVVFQPPGKPEISPLSARTLDLAIAAQKLAPMAQVQISAPPEPPRAYRPLRDLVSNYLIGHGLSPNRVDQREILASDADGPANPSVAGNETTCSL